MTEAPKQWLPPPPETPSDRMAQAIYAQLVSAHEPSHPPHMLRLQSLREIAKHAAAVYFGPTP